MQTVEQALAILRDAVEPLETETVDLQHAAGRVLAATVLADREFPPTDRSAMDGFAVRAGDLAGPGGTLSVVGEVRAGQPVGDRGLTPGQAMKIFTGAIIPAGADAVVMVERTSEDRQAGTVRVEIQPTAGDHIRRRGQDLEAGATVLEAGVVIQAPEIAALSSVGCVRPTVFRTPTVHVLTTGDEVVPPERTPGEHQVRNSNACTLLAQLHELGLAGCDLGIAPDRPPELAALLRRGISGDVLLVTGGVSVGEYDLVDDALKAAGMRQLFHGVAIKPGKPMLAGRTDSCIVFGLPGNPVSAYCGFAVFVAPTLRRLLGCRRADNREVTAVLGSPLRARPGRRTYPLARLEFDGERFVGEAVPSTGSGDVLSLARANGFLITESDASTVEPGALLNALLWRDFDLR